MRFRVYSWGLYRDDEKDPFLDSLLARVKILGLSVLRGVALGSETCMPKVVQRCQNLQDALHFDHSCPSLVETKQSPVSMP